MSIERKDSLLVPYVTNWDERVTATPSAFSFTSAQAVALHDVVEPYVDAYNAMMVARGAGTQSKTLTAAKNSAKEALLEVLKPMYAQVQASNTVTPENKEALGVTIRKAPSPIGVPTEQPTCDIKNVVGYTISLHVHGDDESRKGLPDGVHGIMVYTYTGSTPSADGSGWVNQGVVTRSNFEIELPSSTVPGSQVWFRCCYFSPRGECGPASDAVYTHVQFATSSLLQAA